MDARGTTVANTWTIQINPLTVGDTTIVVADNNQIDIDLTVSGGMPPFDVVPLQLPTLGTLNGIYPDITFTPYVNSVGSETITLELTDNLGNMTQADLEIIVCQDGATYPIADGDVEGLRVIIDAIHESACGDSSVTIELAENGDYVFEELIEITSYASDIQRSALPVISRSLTLRGNGATLRRASNAPTGRIITIAYNGSSQINIENLRIMNGYQLGDPHNAGLQRSRRRYVS